MPEISGIAMLSAMVTLYANNQIVGSTIVATNGQWSVTSQELADGNYDLSVEIRSQQGAIIKQVVKRVTIDTAAPQIASVTGLMDGVAWDASDVFSGTLRDADNLTQLQYWIDNGTKQTIGLTANASNLNFNNIALSQISTLSANAEHKLYLKAIDRAGNETQYDYSFMRLDLPELTEDTDWTGPVNGGEDDRTGSGSGFTGGALPSGAGGYYYIGAGGGWGYSSGSGGSGNWNPGNFGSSDGNPPLPTKPGQDPNEQLTYLQALNVILNTAVDALSKHSSIVSKKQVLGEFKSDLLAMGKVIEFYGLHESFKTEFNELFSLGYDQTDDRVSWQEAVMAGWKFAKSVALDSKPVRLKAFESQIFGIVRGMMVRENISLSAIQEQELKQTLETFSRRYAVLKPIRYQYSWNSYYSGFEEMIWGIGIRGRVSGRWSWNSGPMFSNGPKIENGWLGGDSFYHLQRLVKGLNAQQIINGFENTHTLISGATRTATLWRSGAAHVRFGEFLNKLMETGFTLTRVGATNPAGLATSSSAWLEGVLEKNVQLVAGGLSQFFQGLDATSSYWGWGDRPYTNIFADTLDYGQQLMKVAAAVDDPVLDAEVLKADFLSEFVNLGGIFFALNPNVSYSSSDSPSPLSRVLIDNYLNHNSSQNLSGDNLEKYLRGVNKYLPTLKNSTIILKSFKDRIEYKNNWDNFRWINSILNSVSTYESTPLNSNSGNFLLASSFERSLNDDEIRYIVRTFDRSIDYSKIRITRGNILSAGSSKTIGNTIHLADIWGSAIFQQDGTSLTEQGLILLVHEVTHVWQWQNGGFAYAPDALIAMLSAWLTTGDRDNAYSWREADRKGQPWASWNPEQQAQAVEDYNRAIQIFASDPRGERGRVAIETTLVLTKYMIKIRDKEGAPSYDDAWKYINIRQFPSIP
jgi:hypothetical protein